MSGASLVIDLTSGEGALVPLSDDDAAEIAAWQADVQQQEAEAARAAQARQAAIRADLDAVTDEPTRRLLTLILRRLGEIAG